jgi:uncharacterized protein (TIGR03086 family)
VSPVGEHPEPVDGQRSERQSEQRSEQQSGQRSEQRSEQGSAERHRRVAATFGARVAATTDWDAPTPVPEWVARDVVSHLVTWFPPFLAGGSGIELPAGPKVSDDPAGAWRHHSAAVQEVLDDPGTTARIFAHAHLPECPLAEAIDRFYTTDVLMHTWDLARAGGQDDGLDPEECAALLAGMRPMDEVLRRSGHYGPAQPVSDDADGTARLMAFIGRDPHWQPPARA